MSSDGRRNGIQRRSEPMLDHAHDAAELADRWFLTATHGLRRASRWARRELGVLGDSAKAAWHTTARVGNRMVARPGNDPAAAPADEASTDGPAPAHTGPGWTGIDIASATPTEEAVRRSPEAGRAPGGAGEASTPSLLLLLRLLGQLVSEHGVVGYELLAEDRRFWRLVSLLQEHNPRNGREPRPRR